MAISLANKHNWRAKGWSQAAVLSCTNIWCIFKQSLTHLRIKLSGSCNPQQGGNNYCHFSHHQASRSHKVVESRDIFSLELLGKGNGSASSMIGWVGASSLHIKVYILGNAFLSTLLLQAPRISSMAIFIRCLETQLRHVK